MGEGRWGAVEMFLRLLFYWDSGSAGWLSLYPRSDPKSMAGLLDARRVSLSYPVYRDSGLSPDGFGAVVFGAVHVGGSVLI